MIKQFIHGILAYNNLEVTNYKKIIFFFLLYQKNVLKKINLNFCLIIGTSLKMS